MGIAPTAIIRDSYCTVHGLVAFFGSGSEVPGGLPSESFPAEPHADQVSDMMWINATGLIDMRHVSHYTLP